MQLADAEVAMPTGYPPSSCRMGCTFAARFFAQLLSFQALVAVCVLALIAAMIPKSMADPDIWWHLRNAQTMLSQHAFVRHDTMSFTARGSPWIDHEWLAELPFYAGWRLGGATGVYVVTVIAIETIFGSLLLLCWRASRSWGTASVVTVVAALLSTISFGPRTLLFGWVCLVAELIVLQMSACRAKLIFLLPLLFGVWINLHGSWMIGLVVLAAHTVLGGLRLRGEWIQPPELNPRQVQTLLWVWLAIVPALFCNPWGWRLVAYPFNLAFHQTLNIANVQEWHSLDLHSVRGGMVIAALLLLVGWQLWCPRKWSLTELALLFVGLWSAFNYSRFLFLFALLAAPIVARSFYGRSSACGSTEKPALNALLMLLVLILLGAAFHKRTYASDTSMQQFPVGAMSALAHLEPHSRLFHEFLWGGYIEWYKPDRAVFIDSRVDIFEYNGTFKDYLDIVRISNTLGLLDRYRIDAVFFEKDTPLIYLLTHTGGWKTEYDDGRHVLLKRQALVVATAMLKDPARAADKSNGKPFAFNASHSQ